MTRKTYCGNLLWQSSLTLLAPPVTREQLMEATRRAKRFVLSHPTTCEAKTCLWYAWNEFDEGGWLCPTRGADGKPDTMRIEALKAALAE